MIDTTPSRCAKGPHPAWGAVILALYVVAMAVALVQGAYQPLFLGLGFRGGQGIDFYCVPKAFINLWHGKSAFDTWLPPLYGPHATWFVLHPAVAVVVGGSLAWLPPYGAYGVFAALSLGLLILSATLVAAHATTAWQRMLIYGALITSPITYWFLFVGNVHGLVVLASALLFVGFHEMRANARRPALGMAPTIKIGCGLLLSLLTKPLLVLIAPALLIVPRTRRVTLWALAAYAAVSAAFMWVPWLNPQGVGTARLIELAVSPSWVKAHLNIYLNHFVLVPEMRDNAMHWLHMVAQSGNQWDHAQIFSLPVMLNGIVGRLPSLQWFALLPVGLSLLLVRRNPDAQARGLIWLLVLALATHFLAYAIAWEYQYIQLQLVAAVFLCFAGQGWRRTITLAALALLYLPTPYCLWATDALNATSLLLMRATRVVPALVVAAVAFDGFIRDGQELRLTN